ncbi:MAG: hypothetical protein NTU94_18130 [Planctomycetota bacterium]|nr:hypothetical protein [Planctomycetota bacterium]
MDDPKPTLNPAALSFADAAKILSAAGCQRVTIEMLQEDVAAGAPTNADGTINLLQYAAWVCLKIRDDSG